MAKYYRVKTLNGGGENQGPFVTFESQPNPTKITELTVTKWPLIYQGSYQGSAHDK